MKGPDRQELPPPEAQAGDPEAAVRAAGLLRLLGLARRAGKLLVGFSAVEQAVRRGERPLLITAVDIGSSQRQRVARWQVRRTLGAPQTAAELGAALGRDKVAILGLNDPGFVKGIAELGF